MADVMNRPEVLQFLAAHHWVASAEQLARAEGDAVDALKHARRQRRRSARRCRASSSVRGRRADARGAGAARVSSPPGGRRSSAGRRPARCTGCAAMPTAIVEITIKQCRRSLAAGRAAGWSGRAGSTTRGDVVTRDDGHPVASPLRMLFGLAGQFNQHRFERAAEDVVAQGPRHARRRRGDYLQAIRRSGRGRRQADGRLAGARPRAATASGAERARARSAGGSSSGAGLPDAERQHPLRAAVRRDHPPRHRVAGDPAGHRARATRGGTAATSASAATKPAIGRAAPSAGSCVRFDEHGGRDRVAVIRGQLQAVYRSRSQESEGAERPVTVVRIGTGS